MPCGLIAHAIRYDFHGFTATSSHLLRIRPRKDYTYCGGQQSSAYCGAERWSSVGYCGAVGLLVVVVFFLILKIVIFLFGYYVLW